MLEKRRTGLAPELLFGMGNRPTSASKETAFDVYQRSNRAPVALEPTFPIDVKEVERLREAMMLESPKFLVWQLLAQLGSRFTLLSRFSNSWAEIEPELSQAVVEHVIKQSNAAQNYVVHSLIQILRDRGNPEKADLLCRFLNAKQNIEHALKTNRRLATQRADVETLVDSIIQEVCNEIFLLSDLQADLDEAVTSIVPTEEEREQRVESLTRRVTESRIRIGKAFETIHETEKQTTFQQPPRPKTPEANENEHAVLDRLIEALREENTLSKTVNERMQAELPSSD